MSDSMDRRRFLGVTAMAGLSTGLAGEAAGPRPVTGPYSPGREAEPGPRPGPAVLDRGERLCRREPWQPQALHAQGRGPREGPAHAGDLAAGDRRGRIVPDRSTEPAGGRHGPRPGRAQGAGEDARRQVPEGHAVQQHPLRRWVRGSGRACRSARCCGASARSGTSAGSTTGASTTTTRSSSSSRRSATTR